MKELPTLPPEGRNNHRDSSTQVEDSDAPQRPILPVDADLEIAIPEDDETAASRSPDTLPVAQKTGIFSPFIIEGSLADGVDPLPVPPSND